MSEDRRGLADSLVITLFTKASVFQCELSAVSVCDSVLSLWRTGLSMKAEQVPNHPTLLLHQSVLLQTQSLSLAHTT